MSELIGREREAAVIRRFFREAGSGLACLVLQAEPGMGKTTLWRVGIEMAKAQGIGILSASPDESERDLAFAVLSDLLRPIQQELWSTVPPPQRHALQVALKQADPGTTAIDPAAVGLGLVGLLQSLTKSAPYLIAIDDVPWIDEPSLRALRFACRRLSTEPITVLLTSRTSSLTPEATKVDLVMEDRTALLELEPLGLEELDLILTRRLSAAFSRTTLLQLGAASGGNPLFALEIGRALLKQGGPQAGEALPVPYSGRDLFSRRLKTLPADTRTALQAIAALVAPTEPILQRVLPHDTVGRILRPALTAGLIRFDGEVIRFAHPVIRSAIYSELTPEERRRLHTRIANLVDDPDDRAYHLSLATQTADAVIAAELDAAGMRADSRGAPEIAAQFLQRAATLTPPHAASDQANRFLRAVDCSVRAGDMSRARILLEERLAIANPGPMRARILHRLGMIRFWEAGGSAAQELLRQALTICGPDLTLEAALERDLAMVLVQAGRPRQATSHAARSRTIAKDLGDSVLTKSASMQLASAGYLTDGQLAADREEWLRVAASEFASDGDLTPAVFAPGFLAGTVFKWSDDFISAKQTLEKALEATLSSYDESRLPPILFHLGELEMWMGNWSGAKHHAARLAAVTRMSGAQARDHMGLTLEAIVQSHFDDPQRARSSARQALERAEQAGDAMFGMRNLATLGFIELSVDNLVAARVWYEHLHQLFAAGGYGAPGVFRYHADFIEVVLGLGINQEAEQHTAWLEERAIALNKPWPRAMAARCRGLVYLNQGDVESGLDALERALEYHDSLAQPFELARTTMLLGIALRRAKRKQAARQRLTQAQTIFDQLGTTRWSARAAAETTRLGRRIRDPSQLTATESRVAELVAAGQSNREVADRLFLSVKTVEASLSRIYLKLEVRSRAALAARLASERKV